MTDSSIRMPNGFNVIESMKWKSSCIAPWNANCVLIITSPKHSTHNATTHKYIYLQTTSFTQMSGIFTESVQFGLCQL